MDSALQIVPPASSISSSVVSFLDERLHTNQDLSSASSSLASQLQSQCFELEQTLDNLNSNLHSSLLSYASFSDQTLSLINLSSSNLTHLSSFTQSNNARILPDELPSMAKEVARVEIVRAYAETALKLDALVGDIEDAVSSSMRKNLRKHSSSQSSEELRLLAIERLGQAENVLTTITKTQPQWTRLVSAVDHRIDRALAILRPQAIADHRALLISLGWPPRFSSLVSSNLDAPKSAEVANPLFTMQGDLKHQYCKNFLALCHLQELQRKRKSRQLEGHNREVALRQPLWAIEELVSPISIACQKHFSKWIDQVEFIFALVYKITRDYVDTMDELLQPLVDESRLIGYSCREEWVSAMVTSLITYLAKEIFPTYVNQLEDEIDTGIKSQARISWLHIVDLMITFDKRVKSLVSHSGIAVSLQEDANLPRISSLSIFCDRPDWLDLWSEIELRDTLDKLKPELDNDRNWKMKIEGASLLSGPENYKSPAVSGVFLRRLSLVVDRCRSIPTYSLKSRFLRLVGSPLIQRFLDCVLGRCQEAEGLTALTDNDALIKVTNSVNAAHYFESVLKEWCEDIFFLEMGFESDHPGMSVDDNDSRETQIDGSIGGIFNEEIENLEGFRNEWVEKISVVVLRGFDAKCRDYMKNRRQWQEKGEEGWAVSKYLIGALEHLQEKMAVIEENLNRIDFVGAWRSLAGGLDRLLFNGILMSNVKFNECGIERFSHDMEVLLGTFRAWCLRPEGFFPKLSEGLKVLKMGEEELEDSLREGKKDKGIRYLGRGEVEKIVNSRVFSS
ncbi:RINT-1 / TIP-1 family [Euphorbia peplus]|nr:RINT-1 / TIP-1 family [Euphorbia peplus]